ncbi:hypothetical protein CPB85DRAFT_587034 [Mucidula mucida]|nr:hypothetical protein CPB85DRAFT_587034 [Mucidula mucida]
MAPIERRTSSGTSRGHGARNHFPNADHHRLVAATCAILALSTENLSLSFRSHNEATYSRITRSQSEAGA